jgi:fucose permease
MSANKRSDALLVGMAFITFIVIGLSAGMMGVAWPSLRDTFGVGDDAYGALSLVSMAGSLIVTVYSGRLVQRLGIGPLMLANCAAGALFTLGYALAPGWGWLVAAVLALSVGTGTINPGINTYMAMTQSAGRMNWLHACFGLGAMLGPGIMTWMLRQGASWRGGYAFAAAAYLALALAYALTLKRWPRPAAPGRTPRGLQARPPRLLAMPALWISLLLFFVLTGMEATAEQWPYTLFTAARGIDAVQAGAWVSAYWASLTLGRVAFGVVADRIAPAQLVRACMGGAVLGAAGIWAAGPPWLNLGGLVLTGFCLAPLFPVLTSNTAQRLGLNSAANATADDASATTDDAGAGDVAAGDAVAMAIGYQITAVKLGLAAVPALGGVLAERLGAASIAPFLLVVAVIMFALHEASLAHRSL